MCGLLGTHQGLHLLNLRILETQRMQSEDSMERDCAERVSEWRCRLDAAAVMGVVVGALDPRDLVHHADAHVAGLAPEAVHLDALAQTRGIGGEFIHTYFESVATLKILPSHPFFLYSLMYSLTITLAQILFLLVTASILLENLIPITPTFKH